MSQDASAGRLYADVVADTSGFSRGLKARLNAEVKGLKVKVATELDAKRLGIDARKAAREASKDPNLKIKVAAGIDVAKSRAEIKRGLREATAGDKPPTIKVKVEIDVRQARAEIERFVKERRKLTIQADVDTKKAEEKLNETTRKRRKANIDVGVSGAGELGKTLTSLGKIPMLVGGIGIAVSAVGNLAGGLVAVASAGAQAIGVIGALPALGAAIGQGLGAAFLGLSGVGAAVTALQKADAQASSSTGTAARARVAAARSVASAQEALGKAQTQADRQAVDSAERVATARTALARTQVESSRRIEDAESSLSHTQDGVRRAQLALTQAREDATRRIRDMSDSLKDAALSEEGAAIAVERARRRLAEVNGSTSSSGLDKQEADLAYREALQQQTDIKHRNKDLREDYDKTAKAGVEGAAEVVDAKNALADAQEREAADERDLADARRQAAQDTADAQKAINDALRDQARSTADAQQSIADASRRVAEAQKDAKAATAGTGTAAQALDAAMAKLSPTGQKFARFLANTVVPKVEKLKKATQDAILPGIQNGITKAMPFLSTFQGGIVQSGRVLGGFANKLGGLFATPLFQGKVARIMDNNNDALNDFSGAGVAAVRILTNLTVAAGPLLKRFARWVRSLAEAKAAVSDTNEANGKLGKFFDRAGDKAALLGRILKHLSGGIIGVFKGAMPAGDGLLKTLDHLVKRFDDWANSAKGQASIKKFFDGVAPVVQAVGGAFDALVQTFILLSQGGGSGGGLSAFFDTLTGALDALNTALANPVFAHGVDLLLVLSGVGGALAVVAGSVLRVGRNIGKLGRLTGFTKLIGWIRGSKDAIDDELPADKKKKDALDEVGKSGEKAGTKLRTKFVSAVKASTKIVASGAKAVGRMAAAVARAGWNALLTAGRVAIQTGAFIVQKTVMLAARGATLLWAGAQAVLNAVMSLNPMILITLLIIALVAAVIYAYKHFTWFHKAVQAAWKYIRIATVYAWNKVLKPYLAAMGRALGHVGGVFVWLYKTAKSAWGKLTDAIGGARKIISAAFDAIKSGAKKVGDSFGAAKDAAKKAWDKLKGVAADPVRFVIDTVYNRGIRSVWNKVASLTHLKGLDPLPVPKGFADGGVFDSRSGRRVVPGYEPGRDRVNARLSRGEGIVVPETVRGLARTLGTSAVGAMRWLNSQFSRRVAAPAGSNQFAGGGVFGYLGRKAKSVGSWTAGGLRDVGSAVKGFTLGALKSGAQQALKPLRSLISKVMPANPPIVGMIGKTAGALLDKLVGVVGDKDPAASGGGVLVAPGGGAAAANMAIGQRLAQQLYGWVGPQWQALRNLWTGESGWNANAQNPTSTAYGIPQMLNSTWGSVGAKKTANPTGQITAGLKYVKQAYGSPSNALAKWLERTPHWYGGGGIAGLADGATVNPRPGGTLALLAERGRSEAVVDEGLLNARLGRDDAVADKLDRVIAAIEGMPRHGPITIPVYGRTQSAAEIARTTKRELGWAVRK